MLIVSSQFAIPQGYRFLPTKQEIFQFYLKPAINGEPLSCNILTECEIYGEDKEPWKLFNKAVTNSFWVFTKLKKKNKSRIDRTAGCGCWHGRNIKEVKDESGNILGFDKYFSFTCKKRNTSSQDHANGNWIMHEYSLREDGLSEFVICEIKNKDSAVGLGHQEDGGKPKNKKHKTLEVNDEDMSFPSIKKVCVEGNLNQANIDPSNEELSYQESHHPNMLLSEISTSSPNVTDASVCIGPEEVNHDPNKLQTSSPEGDQKLGQPDLIEDSIYLDLDSFEELKCEPMAPIRNDWGVDGIGLEDFF
ncbi:hypothetical protein REPUB_Repub20aG0029000 [Reevesia pubescens]